MSVSPSETDLHDAFEWLRYEALANNRLAGVAITEWVRLKEEISRLKRENKWKPIETAPTDGREVILAVETRAGTPHGVLVGHYMPGGHCIEDHPPIAAGWYFWNGCMFDKAAKPTHWMEKPHHPKWPADGWQARAQKPSND